MICLSTGAEPSLALGIAWHNAQLLGNGQGKEQIVIWGGGLRVFENVLAQGNLKVAQRLRCCPGARSVFETPTCTPKDYLPVPLPYRFMGTSRNVGIVSGNQDHKIRAPTGNLHMKGNFFTCATRSEQQSC